VLKSNPIQTHTIDLGWWKVEKRRINILIGTIRDDKE